MMYNKMIGRRSNVLSMMRGGKPDGLDGFLPSRQNDVYQGLIFYSFDWCCG